MTGNITVTWVWRMTFFKFWLSINHMKAEVWILAGFLHCVISLCVRFFFISSKPNGSFLVGSYTFPSGEAPRQGKEGFTTSPASKTMNCLHVFCIFLLYRDLTISSCYLPWRMDDTFDKSFGTNMSLTKDSVGGLFLFKTLPKLDAVSLLLLWNNHSGSRDWRTVIFSTCCDSANEE